MPGVPLAGLRVVSPGCPLAIQRLPTQVPVHRQQLCRADQAAAFDSVPVAYPRAAIPIGVDLDNCLPVEITHRCHTRFLSR